MGRQERKLNTSRRDFFKMCGIALAAAAGGGAVALGTKQYGDLVNEVRDWNDVHASLSSCERELARSEGKGEVLESQLDQLQAQLGKQRETSSIIKESPPTPAIPSEPSPTPTTQTPPEHSPAPTQVSATKEGDSKDEPLVVQNYRRILDVLTVPDAQGTDRSTRYESLDLLLKQSGNKTLGTRIREIIAENVIETTSGEEQASARVLVDFFAALENKDFESARKYAKEAEKFLPITTVGVPPSEFLRRYEKQFKNSEPEVGLQTRGEYEFASGQAPATKQVEIRKTPSVDTTKVIPDIEVVGAIQRKLQERNWPLDLIAKEASEYIKFTKQMGGGVIRESNLRDTLSAIPFYTGVAKVKLPQIFKR